VLRNAKIRTENVSCYCITETYESRKCTVWTKPTITDRYSTLCTQLLIYLLTYLPRTDAPIGDAAEMLIRRDKEENAVGEQSKSPGIVSWLRFLTRTVPVARNINTIKEGRKDQSYLFGRVGHRNKSHENCPEFGSRQKWFLQHWN
jgi:hypothetical protein